MSFIDLHCDTVMDFYLHDEKLKENTGHIDMAKLKRGKALAQCFAIFVPTHGIAEKINCTDSPYDYFRNAYDVYQRELAENQEDIAPAITVDDIERNQTAGKVSAILTLEDAVHLEGNPVRVDELQDMGVRIASLTWNYENSLGYPNSTHRQTMEKGLKPFGIEAVRRMNQLGIVVDVSHLSDGGFYDVVRHTDKPFIATHSCARALCNHPRNLTDEMLKLLGDRGGIVGVNFYSAFLTHGCQYTEIDDIIRHLRYMGNLAGIDALALGSDFDGIDCELEFGDYGGMPSIADALSRHFTASQVEKICYRNVLRILA